MASYAASWGGGSATSRRFRLSPKPHTAWDEARENLTPGSGSTSEEDREPFEARSELSGPRSPLSPRAATWQLPVSGECDCPTPRFLLATGRHALRGCLAFVRVESDPPRPRRRERPAGGPPTVLGPRHSQASPMAGEGSAATGEEAGRGRDPAANGTAPGATAPGHLRGGALGDAGRPPERQDASGEGHQPATFEPARNELRVRATFAPELLPVSGGGVPTTT